MTQFNLNVDFKLINSLTDALSVFNQSGNVRAFPLRHIRP